MSHPWKTQPRDYQLDVLRTSWALRAYFLAWEPGVGKSKPIADQAAALYLRGEIKQLLVVAPKGVHFNWVDDQLPTHMPDETNYYAVAVRADKFDTKWHQQELQRLLTHRGLRILCVNYDALRLKKFLERPKNGRYSGYLWDFVTQAPTMGVLDESRKIKNPDAERTKAALAFSDRLPWKRCADGTPVPKGPHDIYSQVEWLDSDFWRRHGMSSFTAFQRRYTKYKESKIPMVIGGKPITQKAFNSDGTPKIDPKTGKQAVEPRYVMLEDGYKNLDDLHEKLKPLMSRLRKEDVLKELPAKIYQYRPFELSAKQRAHYEELREKFLTEVDGETVTATIAMVRLLRLAQVTSNYLPVGHEGLGTRRMAVIDEKDNPRLESLLDQLDELPGQTVIWCRFVEDTRIITSALDDCKLTWARFDGQTSDDDRRRYVAEFKGGDKQYMVARPSSGLGSGFTLTNAHYVVYYNNEPGLDARVQSEDRVHRLGQTVPPTIVDMVARGTVDKRIVEGLRAGWDVASLITDGHLREWLQEAPK